MGYPPTPHVILTVSALTAIVRSHVESAFTDIWVEGEVSTIVVDMHAEATSEKMAMGWYLDGTVSGVFGTHTHVQTADERILPKGTAYLTETGMTGPSESVIGIKKEIAIEKFLTQMPRRFEVASGPCVFSAVLFEVDQTLGKAVSIERIRLQD